MVNLCALCGVDGLLHGNKAHPFQVNAVVPSYDFGVALGAASLAEDDIYERVQREGREILERPGAIVDFDTRGTVDLGEESARGIPAGRIVIESFAGRGLVGDAPDPQHRIYVEQSDAWARIFGRIVALHPEAQKREPALAPGQRIIYERCATQRFLVQTPTGGESLFAEFFLLHVDDIYAIA